MLANLELVLALGEMRAHHAGDAVAVAQPHPEECEPRGLRDQLLGMRAAPQEGEIRRDGELDVAECNGLSRHLPPCGGGRPAEGRSGGGYFFGGSVSYPPPYPSPTRGEGTGRGCLPRLVHHANIPCRNQAGAGIAR